MPAFGLFEAKHVAIMPVDDSGFIVGLRPANERRRYFVTMSIIDWAQA